MSKPTVSADLFRRHTTPHRGISYRVRRDGSRTYFVSWKGRYLPAGPTEQAALARQAELRSRQARGEAPVLLSKVLFGELAESWWELKAPRLREKTRGNYRSALDLVLLPRFGDWHLAAIDADAISLLIRDLEREGIHSLDPRRPLRPLGRSSIENYLKPARGVFALALRRRLIPVSPFAILTSEDLPQRQPSRQAHEWTPAELESLLQASADLAQRSESRYSYVLLLRVVATLGLRLGEVLGLRWEDFDKDTSLLHVRRQWLRSGSYGPTKTAAGARTIPLPQELRDALIAQRLESTFSGDDEPIFASLTGAPLGHRNVTQRGFEPAAKIAGLSGVSFHSLRHAAASRLIHHGLDPVTVANVLGHDDPHVTLKVYAHLYDRSRTDEIVRRALSVQP
jgi:integrase